MKIPAYLTCLLAALLAAMPLTKAHAQDDVSFDLFYNSLADDGDWYNTPDYGYVWKPLVAKDEKWRPYSDGYWAETDDGWTWVSYESFGWATYHYGRWARVEDTGWVWVPGYEWGPGWVSWRTSENYVGWAPLPPQQAKADDSGNTGGGGGGTSVSVDYNQVEPEDAGYTPTVDQDYDLGPDDYCFVQTADFGAPRLDVVFLPPERNIVFLEDTVNVTNIVYRRGGDRIVVINNGPDFDFINRHVHRPIQRLRLERNNDLAFVRDNTRGGHNPIVVRDGVLRVPAPMIARRPVNFAQMKPTRIKQQLVRPQIVHGWQNKRLDPVVVQRVRQQVKEQAKNPNVRRPGNPGTTGTPGGNPLTTGTPRGTPAGTGPTPVDPRHPGKGTPPPIVTPANTPAGPTPGGEGTPRGPRHPGKGTPPPIVTPANTPAGPTPGGEGTPRGPRHPGRGTPSPVVTPTAESTGTPGGRHRPTPPPNTPGTTTGTGTTSDTGGKRKDKDKRPTATPGTGNGNGNAEAEAEKRRQQQQQQQELERQRQRQQQQQQQEQERQRQRQQEVERQRQQQQQELERQRQREREKQPTPTSTTSDDPKKKKRDGQQ